MSYLTSGCLRITGVCIAGVSYLTSGCLRITGVCIGFHGICFRRLLQCSMIRTSKANLKILNEQITWISLKTQRVPLRGGSQPILKNHTDPNLQPYITLSDRVPFITLPDSVHSQCLQKSAYHLGGSQPIQTNPSRHSCLRRNQLLF